MGRFVHHMSDQATESDIDEANRPSNTPSGEEEAYDPVPERGTGSKAHIGNNPLEGDRPDDPSIQMVEVDKADGVDKGNESGEGNDSTRLLPALKVQADGKIRIYALTDTVKNHYEGTMAAAHKDDEWFDLHWVGTELVCEYLGHSRHKDMMKREKDNPQTREEDMQNGLKSTPPYPGDPVDEPQKTLDSKDMNREEHNEESFHDTGLYPTHQFERLDLAQVASERPLEFEDTLILLDQEPVEEKSQSEELSGDIPDIREDDMSDKTLDAGQRGARWTL